MAHLASSDFGKTVPLPLSALITDIEPKGQFHHEDETMIFEKPNQTKNRKTNLKIFRQNKIPLF